MKQMIAAMALVAALSASVQAQDQGGGFPPPPPPGQGGPGGGQHGPMMGMRMMGGPGLLLRPEVVKELNLTQDQIEKIKAMMPPRRGQGGRGGFDGGPGGGGPGGGGGFGGGQGGPPPGQGGQGGPPPGGFGGGQGGPPPGGPGGQGGPGGPGGMEKRFDAQLKTILSDTQFTRYQQISVQVQLPMSLNRPDVAEKLALTDDQKDELRSIMESGRPDPQDGPPDPATMEKKHQEMAAKALAILTADQKKKWDDLTGKPFHLSPPKRD